LRHDGARLRRKFFGNAGEPTTGIEPVTYGLRNRCSTS
jgi:hypothetical protein